jgi:hypothetical protein
MRSDVRILSATEFSRISVEIPRAFELVFPRRWRASPVKNRYADAIERETIRWLGAHAIGRTPSEQEKLRKFECGAYGGYSLPLADFHTGVLVTQYISLWLFWDDMQVEEDLGWSVDQVVAALVGHPALASPGRYVAAWADLGARLRRTQSAPWIVHLEAAMRQWLDNAKAETSMAKSYRNHAQMPDFDALFECRTVSIGMFPTFHLIEFAEGFELPAAVHEHPSVVSLKRLASRLVGMGNDLGGLAKDIRNGWINLVLALMARSSCSISEAFERIVAIHNHDVRAFDRLAEALPSFGSETDALVRGWVQAVRHNVYGFALWESRAERYQEHKAVVGKRALIAPVSVLGPRKTPPGMRESAAGV